MILIIDNYDSFVYNLSRYLQELGYETEVVRHDAITLAEISEKAPQAIVLSPGPCTPNEAGICLSLIQHFYRTIPIIGICLGHQAIGQAFGARVVRAKLPRHGKASLIRCQTHPIFKDLSSSLSVGRYHSLVLNNLPCTLESLAISEDDQEIMAVAHREYPVVGFQFHPESILTEQGHKLMDNALQWCLQKNRRQV